MQIFLRTLRGDLLTLEAAPSDMVDDILATIEEAHRAPAHLQRLVWGGRALAGEFCLSDYGVTQDCTLELVLGLKGGKGGFGALLRGSGRSGKTDNTDAMRDLSGRRLRHVNAEKKLAEWASAANDRQLALEAEKEDWERQRAEARLLRAQVDIGDVKEAQRAALAALESAVQEGLGAASSAKRPSGFEPARPAKKPRFFDNLDGLSSDSSDEDEESDTEGPLPIAATTLSEDSDESIAAVSARSAPGEPSTVVAVVRQTTVVSAEGSKG